MVVILSTHIVEDVADLCQRLAVISEGSVRLTGEPRDIVEKLQGKIWRKLIDKHELERHKEELAVISTRWVSGSIEIHAYSDEALDSGFEQVDADLKDAYFSTLNVAQAGVAEAA